MEMHRFSGPERCYVAILYCLRRGRLGNAWFSGPVFGVKKKTCVKVFFLTLKKRGQKKNLPGFDF